MSLDGITSTFIPYSVNGLQTIDASVIYDNGVQLQPSTYVTYTGSTAQVDLNNQNLVNVNTFSSLNANVGSAYALYAYNVSAGTPTQATIILTNPPQNPFAVGNTVTIVGSSISALNLSYTVNSNNTAGGTFVVNNAAGLGAGNNYPTNATMYLNGTGTFNTVTSNISGTETVSTLAVTVKATAPTPVTTDNSTNVATTAYVQAQGYVSLSNAIERTGPSTNCSPQILLSGGGAFQIESAAGGTYFAVTAGTTQSNQAVVISNGVGPPSLGVQGTNDALTLYAGTTTVYPYAIGIDSNTMWFNTGGTYNIGTTGYKWYNAGVLHMTLAGNGYLGLGGFNPSSYALGITDTNEKVVQVSRSGGAAGYGVVTVYCINGIEYGKMGGGWKTGTSSVTTGFVYFDAIRSGSFPSSGSSSNALFYADWSSGAGFNVNLGIGTTTPSAQLTLAGGATSAVFQIDNGNWFTAKNASGVAENYLWPRWVDNITYFNFGSGGFNIRNNSSAQVMWMSNSGYVGIGTTSPAYNLDIAGQCRVANGDSSYYISGPNSSGVYLYTGSSATTSKNASLVSQVITTNGNLHIDCSQDGSRAIYLNYFNAAASAGGGIQGWGPWTHNGYINQNANYGNIVCAYNGVIAIQGQFQMFLYQYQGAWGGGWSAGSFSKASSQSAIRVTGQCSYYVSAYSFVYITMRLYSTGTGSYYYYYTAAATNVTNNHTTFPLTFLATGVPSGTISVYFYLSGGSFVTDTNDTIYSIIEVFPN